MNKQPSSGRSRVRSAPHVAKGEGTCTSEIKQSRLAWNSSKGVRKLLVMQSLIPVAWESSDQSCIHAVCMTRRNAVEEAGRKGTWNWKWSSSPCYLFVASVLSDVWKRLIY
jgi:hypothetical protein